MATTEIYTLSLHDALPIYVTERVDVHAEPDDADNREHQRRKVVELEPYRDREGPEAQPFPRGGEAPASDREREGAARDKRGGDYRHGGRSRPPPPQEKHDQRRRGQRGNQDEKGGV